MAPPRRRDASRASGRRALELLGRRPQIVLPEGARALSGRHADILAVLLLGGRGLTAEELTLEVYGETRKPVTLRAEMSRLRRALGGVLQAKPYAFAVPVSSDLQEAEQLLDDGRLADALACVTGDRLLPASARRASSRRASVSRRACARRYCDPATRICSRRGVTAPRARTTRRQRDRSSHCSHPAMPAWPQRTPG